MADIIENLKHKYKAGNVITRLLFINTLVFVALKVVMVIFTLFNIHAVDPVTFLGVPSHVPILLSRFWTPITYMFVHEGFLHLLFNMLWLYWFWADFPAVFLWTYPGKPLPAGWVGGSPVLYAVAFNTIPYYTDMDRGWMIGASAAVMSIVMVLAFIAQRCR